MRHSHSVKSSVLKIKKSYNEIMQILDSKLQKQVKVVSKRLGLNPNEVINRAVSSYLDSVKEFTDFQKELHLWDVLSAETLRKYKF